LLRDACIKPPTLELFESTALSCKGAHFKWKIRSKTCEALCGQKYLTFDVTIQGRFLSCNIEKKSAMKLWEILTFKLFQVFALWVCVLGWIWVGSIFDL